MIVVIGDNHLADSRPWALKASEAQIDYIINHPLNTSENTAIFTGDLVDNPFMSGRVYKMLLRLFTGLKFKEVYIVQGNHDLKMDKSEQPVLAYEFLHDKDIMKGFFSHIIPIKKPTALTIEKMEVLFLPFIYETSRGSIKDYEHLPEELTNKQYDLCVTHVADNSLDSYPGTLIDLSAVKSTYWASGHVHTPSSHYVGSVVPNSSAESGERRQFRTYSKEKGEDIVYINEILGYFTVKFPDELPTTSAQISVFTILNCADESIAYRHYGDIFIRKCIPSVSLDKDAFSSLVDSSDSEGISMETLYKEWKEATKQPPALLTLCDKYFKVS